MKIFHINKIYVWDLNFLPGFRSRSREQGGSETLRHPVDISLLELMKAYIF